MKRIHIIGRKNSGKTTLIVELVEEMSRRGYRVGTIKHTHHDHELDTPGKDSHRHRKAGSAAVGILTRGMNAIFWPPSDQASCEKDDQQKYDQFDAMMNACDVVLVEGDSKTTAKKIEVYRSVNGEQPIANSDATIAAVISDNQLDIATPIWKRANLNSIVDNMELLLHFVAARS